MAGFWDITDDSERLEVTEAEADALEAERFIRFDRDAGVYRPLVNWLAIEEKIYWLTGRNVTAEPR